jgi:hypothetical protein
MLGNCQMHRDSKSVSILVQHLRLASCISHYPFKFPQPHHPHSPSHLLWGRCTAQRSTSGLAPALYLDHHVPAAPRLKQREAERICLAKTVIIETAITIHSRAGEHPLSQ